MVRSEELRLRAREFERGDDKRTALDLYLRLVEDADIRSPAALWSRIGDLQLELEPERAEESYNRSIELFVEAGQRNNAIAVCFRLLGSGSRSIAPQLKLGELAIAAGYRAFARSAIGEFARRTAEDGRAEEALGAIDAYLEHFPDETELWRDWIAEILGLGREGDALRVLRHLWEHFAERGDSAAAERVREQIVRLSPGDDPRPGAIVPHAHTPPPTPASTLRPPADSRTIVDNRPAPGGEMEIIPLAGLEPTRVDSVWDAEETDGTAEPLPLLESSGVPRNPVGQRGKGSELPADAPAGGDEGAAEPFPLLDSAAASATADRPGPLDPALPDGGGPRFPDPALPDGGRPRSIDHPILPDHGEPRSEDPAPPGDDGRRSIGPASPEPGRPRSADPESDLSSSTRLAESGTRHLFDHAAVVAELRRLSPRSVAPAEPHAHFELGVAFKEMGLLDDAIARFAAAIDAGHPPGPVLESVGELLVGRGDHPTALRILTLGLGAAAPTEPGSAGVLYWLARSHEETGDRAEARRLLEATVSLDPGYRDAAERLRRSGSAGF